MQRVEERWGLKASVGGKEDKNVCTRKVEAFERLQHELIFTMVVGGMIALQATGRPYENSTPHVR